METAPVDRLKRRVNEINGEALKFLAIFYLLPMVHAWADDSTVGISDRRFFALRLLELSDDTNQVITHRLLNERNIRGSIIGSQIGSTAPITYYHCSV